VITKGRGLLRGEESPLTPGHSDGATATEYALKLVFVIVLAMVAVGALGAKVTEIFTAVARTLS
jgi:Flp pilus assembly pilin Flp